MNLDVGAVVADAVPAPPASRPDTDRGTTPAAAPVPAVARDDRLPPAGSPIPALVGLVAPLAIAAAGVPGGHGGTSSVVAATSTPGSSGGPQAGAWPEDLLAAGRADYAPSIGRPSIGIPDADLEELNDDTDDDPRPDGG